MPPTTAGPVRSQLSSASSMSLNPALRGSPGQPILTASALSVRQRGRPRPVRIAACPDVSFNRAKTPYSAIASLVSELGTGHQGRPADPRRCGVPLQRVSTEDGARPVWDANGTARLLCQ